MVYLNHRRTGIIVSTNFVCRREKLIAQYWIWHCIASVVQTFRILLISPHNFHFAFENSILISIHSLSLKCVRKSSYAKWIFLYGDNTNGVSTDMRLCTNDLIAVYTIYLVFSIQVWCCVFV